MFTVVTVAGPVAAMPLQDALAVFQDDRVIVEYSDRGRSELEAAIEAIKSALGVPGDLDEESEQAVNAFRIDPEERSLVIKLSQGYFTVGVIFANGEAGEADVYRKGKHWGLKSLRLDPGFAAAEKREGFLQAVHAETDVPALYWACMNWVSLANFDPIGAVSGGVVKKTVAMLERVLEIDEAYDGYGADRVLGSIWGALPRLPFGRYRKNLEQARMYLCHVVDDPGVCGDLGICGVDPACLEYLGNRLVLAEYYLMENGLWADAARVLQSVLDAPVGETYSLFNARAQDDARQLLQEVNKHL